MATGIGIVYLQTHVRLLQCDRAIPLPESLPFEATNSSGQTKERPNLSEVNPRWSIAVLSYFNPADTYEAGRINGDPNGPNNLVPFIAQVAVGRRDKVLVFGNDYLTRTGPGCGTIPTSLTSPPGTWPLWATRASGPGRSAGILGLASSVLEGVESFGTRQANWFPTTSPGAVPVTRQPTTPRPPRRPSSSAGRRGATWPRGAKTTGAGKARTRPEARHIQKQTSKTRAIRPGTHLRTNRQTRIESTRHHPALH